MKRYKNKKMMTITIDKDLYNEFLLYSKRTNKKRSQIINQLIKEYLKNNNNKIIITKKTYLEPYSYKITAIGSNYSI